MDPAQPRQLEMFVDASELSAEAAEALRSIDFAQLLEQTANLSEHNNSLRQRNHINLYCLLAVALKIAITTIDGYRSSSKPSLSTTASKMTFHSCASVAALTVSAPYWSPSMSTKPPTQRLTDSSSNPTISTPMSNTY
jgi:hypothetical protein